ncbi:MAG: hypothetical protein AB8B97_10170 [Granulosicoccus sp.]
MNENFTSSQNGGHHDHNKNYIARGLRASPECGEFVVGGSSKYFGNVGNNLSRTLTGFVPGNTYTVCFYTANAGVAGTREASRYTDDGFWRLAINPYDRGGQDDAFESDTAYNTQPHSYEGEGNQTWVKQTYTFTAEAETLVFSFGVYDAVNQRDQICALMALDGFVVSGDSDNDGLSDIEEINLGTDPFSSDTDGDGLSDGDEVNTTLTDPLDPDSDDDGLLDGQEVDVYGTDPNNPDTDAGGVSDGEEVDAGWQLCPGPGGNLRLEWVAAFTGIRIQY